MEVAGTLGGVGTADARRYLNLPSREVATARATLSRTAGLRVSPKVREVITRRGIRLTNYRELAAGR